MALYDEKNLIGPKSFFQGRLHVNGSLRIEGRFEGPDLEVENLVIGRHGRVKTKIRAGSCIVEGVLIGSIDATVRVILTPTARILGDISTPELIIQNGVVFEGGCSIKAIGEKSTRQTLEQLYATDG
ncbi:MAG: polymer-forming cytoskeletal protein [Spirochaetes bacterium]|nr:polymer-forming cytoskeletal protein [Spirochaetota bacterium]